MGHQILPDRDVADFFLRVLEGFCSPFFSILFSTSFSIRFFFDFGGFWEAKMRPKIEFWRGFWDVFLVPSF